MNGSSKINRNKNRPGLKNWAANYSGATQGEIEIVKSSKAINRGALAVGFLKFALAVYAVFIGIGLAAMISACVRAI